MEGKPLRTQRKNKITLFFIFLCALSAIGYLLYAEETPIVSAEAVFDKADITIGEKVKYVVTVEAPKNAKVEFPVIDSVLAATGFAVKDFGEEKPVKTANDRIRIRQWYLLDTYVTGSYNVPAVTIDCTLPDGSKESAQTKDAFLEVKSVMKEGEKAEDIKDIKGPVEIKVSYKKLITAIVLVLVVISIMAGAIIIYFRYRKHIVAAALSIPPHVMALRELEAIKGMPLDTDEMIEKYYTGVSGIVRRYIENRFNLHAPERTTEEFLSELTNSDQLAREQKNLLRDFLKHCDMVKFAKYGPTKEEIEGVYYTAKKFVEETAEKVATGGNFQESRRI